MKRRLLGRGVVALGLTIGALMLPAAALAASPEVTHGQFDIIGEETNTNICGDWGVFRFTGTGTFTVVDFGNGVLHFKFIEARHLHVDIPRRAAGNLGLALRPGVHFPCNPRRHYRPDLRLQQLRRADPYP